MTEPTTAPSDEVETELFDKPSMAGWHWFTKFLLINVVVAAGALVFVGIFTVWS